VEYPKISIVTPSFNQVQFLEQTIVSVLDQGYPNLEYIIIDGGSKDGSVEIIKKYEKHLAYWVSEKDSGQSEAINKGISRSTGTIFNWLNSDDYYDKEVLKRVAKAFMEGAEVVCGKVRFIYPDNKTALSGKFPHSKDAIEVISSTKYLQPSTFYKTGFIKSIGGVNPLLHYSMDFEIWLKYLLMNGMEDIVIDENILVNFRIHDASKTFLYNAHFEADQLKIFKSIYMTYLNKDADVNGSSGYSFGKYRVKLDNHIIASACNHFFYDLMVRCYGLRDFNKFDELRRLINIGLLNKKQAVELRKMNIRKNVIPVWAYRLLKK
jgi:glycosyltransferase involved in cell wall biosynthesis